MATAAARRDARARSPAARMDATVRSGPFVARWAHGPPRLRLLITMAHPQRHSAPSTIPTLPAAFGRSRQSSACRAAPLLALALAACSGSNGLPDEVVALLAGKGVTVKPKDSHAPAARRGGWLEVVPAPALIDRIVAALGLPECAPEDAGLRLQLSNNGLRLDVAKAYGLTKRPPAFALPGGGQLEFLYLVHTKDNRLLVVAEYASG